MSWLLYKANILHFALGLYSDNKQRNSKRGKDVSHATSLELVEYFNCHLNFGKGTINISEF